jgi:salicylate hydroxylase
MARSARRIAVAGAGIAGLTTALAFAQRGFDVTILERAHALEEVGAGLQLSPNATRVLAQLGVLERLQGVAVEPEEIVLRRATSLRQIGRVPLGDAARKRWGAPYLTIHRADLQTALTEAVRREAAISLRMGTPVLGASPVGTGATVTFQEDDRVETLSCDLVAGADGVWSTLRGQIPNAAVSRFSGYLAWRAVIDAHDRMPLALPADRVTTFLHPRFHLVAYPVRAGRAINLVMLTKDEPIADRWSNAGDASDLVRAMSGVAPELVALVLSAGSWTKWPLHEVPSSGAWVNPSGIALVGDAAHAMTPFAAQGAAMAIEDAAVLSACIEQYPGETARALHHYETNRKPRVAKAVARGAFNRFAWHAAGPIAYGRDIVLAIRPAASLAADMDWLYGYEVPRS